MGKKKVKQDAKHLARQDASRLVLYMHGGSGNHGCEAIINSTCQMIKRPVLLVTNSAAEDRKYTLSGLCDILEERKIREHKLAHIVYYGWRMLTKDRESFMRYRFHKVRGKHAAKLYVSVGGDNYCYPQLVEELILCNRMFHKEGARTILWGCSVEPELLKRADVVEDMKRYDLIVARESLTAQALYDAGISKNVRLHPDPAFALKPRFDALPENFVRGNTVGINISPMIIRNEKRKGVTMQNYEALIRHILENTDMQIALIPHVVWKHDDDRQPLRKLYDTCLKTLHEETVKKRICLMEDHDCQALKGYIAGCRFFIGARTHATIAAYSSLVPTLVVGYSVKARGIAKDLFGTHEGYVLPVQELQSAGDLIAAFETLCKNEQAQRGKLTQIMPSYVEEAKKAGEWIEAWAE